MKPCRSLPHRQVVGKGAEQSLKTRVWREQASASGKKPSSTEAATASTRFGLRPNAPTTFGVCGSIPRTLNWILLPGSPLVVRAKPSLKAARAGRSTPAIPGSAFGPTAPTKKSGLGLRCQRVSGSISLFSSIGIRAGKTRRRFRSGSMVRTAAQPSRRTAPLRPGATRQRTSCFSRSSPLPQPTNRPRRISTAISMTFRWRSLRRRLSPWMRRRLMSVPLRLRSELKRCQSLRVQPSVLTTANGCRAAIWFSQRCNSAI